MIGRIAGKAAVIETGTDLIRNHIHIAIPANRTYHDAVFISVSQQPTRSTLPPKIPSKETLDNGLSIGTSKDI